MSRGRFGLGVTGVLLIVLGLPASTLTLLRVLGLEAGAAVRLESFTPLAAPAYAVLVVVLALAAWRARARLRAAAVVALVVAVAGLGVHLWWWSPMVLGTTPAADGPPVVVMTANMLEGGGDAQQVVDAVRRDAVDVLVIEEITPDLVRRLEVAGIDQLLPNRAGGTNQYVAGTSIFSRLPVQDQQRVDTPMQSYSVRVGDLTLLAVHPSAPVYPQDWVRDQATILDVARRERPDLVVGDFNATLDHVPMQRLVAAGWRDAAELANSGWQPTWPSNELFHLGPVGLPPLVQIDHVFVGSGMTALSTHTVEIGRTDHRGLVATVAPAG